MNQNQTLLMFRDITEAVGFKVRNTVEQAWLFLTLKQGTFDLLGLLKLGKVR